ncbi:MAG: polysaccharide deacetylase family protein [Methanomicrobiales archaeon]|nr:polysaccharide deacetylase family protein [Methanomicrobiales archaeon]
MDGPFAPLSNWPDGGRDVHSMTDREILRETLGRDGELWDVFTSREEYDPLRQEAKGRFTANCSQRKNLQHPVVSAFLVREGLDIEYPEDHPFAICLTHDVDDIHPTLLHRLSHAVNSMRGRDLENRFVPCVYRNFREIMRLEQEYGATSSFFFLAADRDFRRFRYRLEDLEADIGCICDQNHEVGLHGGCGTYCDHAAMTLEKARLERVVNHEIIGYRSHYLQFRVPQTWLLLHESGFKYDSTFGYPDAMGFRNGMCHPYWPFDLKSGRYIDVLEIPLGIMDVHLPAGGSAEAWSAVAGMVDVVAACRGILTLNFHNDTFSNAGKRGRSRVFRKILDLGRQNNAWMTSGEEIYRWWVRHGYRAD